MFKTIESIINGQAFAEALRTRGQQVIARKRLDVLRAELESHRAAAESVTSAIENEIAELESVVAKENAHEDQEAAAPPNNDKADSFASTVGRVLGFLSVGFAMAAFLAWADQE